MRNRMLPPIMPFDVFSPGDIVKVTIGNQRLTGRVTSMAKDASGEEMHWVRIFREFNDRYINKKYMSLTDRLRKRYVSED